MAIPRSRALTRLQGLAPQVERHLAKLAQFPGSQAVRHWRSEIHALLNQMEQMIPHVGKATGAEWASQVAAWREAAGL
jgi:hypothetical protein